MFSDLLEIVKTMKQFSLFSKNEEIAQSYTNQVFSEFSIIRTFANSNKKLVPCVFELTDVYSI